MLSLLLPTNFRTNPAHIPSKQSQKAQPKFNLKSGKSYPDLERSLESGISLLDLWVWVAHPCHHRHPPSHALGQPPMALVEPRPDHWGERNQAYGDGFCLAMVKHGWVCLPSVMWVNQYQPMILEHCNYMINIGSQYIALGHSSFVHEMKGRSSHPTG